MWSPWMVGLVPGIGEAMAAAYAQALGTKISIPKGNGEFMLAPGCAKFVVHYGQVCLAGYTVEDKEECDRYIAKVERILGTTVICPIRSRPDNYYQEEPLGLAVHSKIAARMDSPNRRRASGFGRYSK